MTELGGSELELFGLCIANHGRSGSQRFAPARAELRTVTTSRVYGCSAFGVSSWQLLERRPLPELALNDPPSDHKGIIQMALFPLSSMASQSRPPQATPLQLEAGSDLGLGYRLKLQA